MRNTICQADLRLLVLIATIATPLVVPPEASATAQFSRQYNTSCNTCHTAFPKLNDAFPNRFYLSPALNVGERTQKHPDQTSLRFATFNGETVLEVTGNYYAVYPRERMDANERIQRTFEDVLLPILKILISRFPNDAPVHGYVLDISHRVRGRVLGVPFRTTENVALALSRDAAEQLAAAKNRREQQAVLGQVHVYRNAQPIALRLADEAP